jgi:predicted transcriptional regulator
MNQAARRSNISKSLYLYSIVDSEEEDENIIQELDGCVEDIDSLLGNLKMLLISLASLLAILWQFVEWLQS